MMKTDTQLCKVLRKQKLRLGEGDYMDPVTLKQYAESQGISYEAVRKQVTRYSEVLSDHIIEQNRKRYLDQYAVNFLTERRRESPIILMNMDQSEENERLKEQIETLKTQLKMVQNELLKRKDEQLKAQDRIIALQDEVKNTFEDRARYTVLLEEKISKEKELKEARKQIDRLSRQLQNKVTQFQLIRRKTDNLRKKSELYHRKMMDLQRERDKGQIEPQAFTRSIFGFFRKR